MAGTRDGCGTMRAVAVQVKVVKRALAPICGVSAYMPVIGLQYEPVGTLCGAEVIADNTSEQRQLRSENVF